MDYINLKCGGRQNPEQISREDVCFSWNTEKAGNQLSYRLQIAHDEHFKSVYIDSQKVDSPNNRFIRVRANLSKGVKYFWRVKVYTKAGDDKWSPTQFFITNNKQLSAEWITPIKNKDPLSPSPATRFRKEFSSSEAIKSAYLYASAQGNYTVYINGIKCDDIYLTPGWTDYRHRIQYQKYDVSHLISEGENCVSSVVSNGWYIYPHLEREESTNLSFGAERAFFCQLEIKYQNGKTKTVQTDPTWHSDYKSAYTRCEIYYGADYDSRLEDDFTLPGHSTRENVKSIKQTADIVSQQCPPVKEVGKITPVEILTTSAGETVVDMGQNIVGVPEITLESRLGQEIELVMFETLDENGCVYTKNLRSARQGLKYVAKNGRNSFLPEMTFYGFRYIHVKKWPGEIAKENIKGVVLSSSLESTGRLVTNNISVNRFLENTLWSQLGSSVSIPISNPQSDCRLGLAADAQLFIKTACINFDVYSFYSKWLGDMLLTQKKDGSVSHIIPKIADSDECFAGWGESCIIIPWHIYLVYGDSEILERFYPMMKDFIKYRENTCTPDYIINSSKRFEAWLAGGGVFQASGRIDPSPADLISTAFFAHAANLMQKISQALDKKPEAKGYGDLFQKIKKGFNKEFVTPSGRLAGNTHTSYILSLKFALLDEPAKSRAALSLTKLIEDFGLSSCGLFCKSYVLDVLTENGYHNLALDLALSEEYPSWLYPVTTGATTIWEHWNSIFKDGKVNPETMNSLNYYANGAAAAWFYENIAGIMPDYKSAGYKHFFIHPRPSSKLNNIDCKLKTHFGIISLKCRYSQSVVMMELNVPDNSHATLVLEDCKAYTINSKRKKYSGDIELECGFYEIEYVKNGSILLSPRQAAR